jgi:hypothetical protein
MKRVPQDIEIKTVLRTQLQRNFPLTHAEKVLGGSPRPGRSALTRPSLIHFRLQQAPALQARDCGIDAMAEGGVDAGGGEFGEHCGLFSCCAAVC